MKNASNLVGVAQCIFDVRTTIVITTKVRSLFKDGKQTAGCTEFRTETGLRSLVSVRNSEHPAVCLPSLKRELTLVLFMHKMIFDF